MAPKTKVVVAQKPPNLAKTWPKIDFFTIGENIFDGEFDVVLKLNRI